MAVESHGQTQRRCAPAPIGPVSQRCRSFEELRLGTCVARRRSTQGSERCGTTSATSSGVWMPVILGCGKGYFSDPALDAAVAFREATFLAAGSGENH